MLSVSKPCQVLHLSAATVYGGGEEHVRVVLKGLKEQGWEVALAAPPEAPLAQKVRLLDIPVHPITFGGKSDLLAPWRLWRLIRQCKARIVHSHNRREDLALGLISAALSDCQTITTIHDRVDVNAHGQRTTGLRAMVYKKIPGNMDKLLTVSEATKQDLLHYLPRLSSKVHPITNGCDFSRLDQHADPKAWRPSRNISPEALLVLLSARVRGNRFEKKGHLRLLEAVAKRRANGARWEVVFCGEDDQARQILETQAKSLAVPVTCLGEVSDVGQLYRAVDLTVLPSLFEGLPRALMEAMACRCPVLGSRVDGCVELLSEGPSGLLVEAGSIESLAEGLQTAESLEKRQQLAEAGYQRVRQHYTLEAMTEDHLKVYRELLDA